jgi:hypothetical protein
MSVPNVVPGNEKEAANQAQMFKKKRRKFRLIPEPGRQYRR